MPVTWQNASWLRRLINLAAPNQVEVNPTGAVISTQTVQDARYLSSRENNPAGFWAFTVNAPPLGQNACFFFEAIDAAVPTTLLMHALNTMSQPLAATLAFELVVDPTNTITWAVGPTPVLARGGDPGVDQSVRCAIGEVLAANLPAARTVLPGTDVANLNRTTTNFPYTGIVPPMFSRNAALFFNVESAQQGAHVYALMQGVRDG